MAERWYATLYDGAVNSAKFYDLTLNDDGSVVAKYARVGAANPATHTYTGGRAVFEKKKTEKMRKGYREVELADSPSSVGTNGTTVHRAARKGLLSSETKDSVLEGLVARIAAANKHTITTTSGGRITVSDTGRVLLPGGIVLGPNALLTARSRLAKLESMFDFTKTPPFGQDSDSLRRRYQALEDYFSSVPHAISIAYRNWREYKLTTQREFEAEHRLLDAIEATINSADDSDPDVEFRYRVDLAPDTESRDVIQQYLDSASSVHPVSRLKPVRVFSLTDTKGEAVSAYALQHGNTATRWHGTGTSNVLNILRTGLQFERTSTMDFHGGLFGNGIYSSSMSTKAAGYGYGTWGGQRDDECYVFLAEVARGWEYRITPQRYDWRGSRAVSPEGHTYRSIEVYSAVNGARNPETVVWDTDAVNLRYLVQLGRA